MMDEIAIKIEIKHGTTCNRLGFYKVRILWV